MVLEGHLNHCMKKLHKSIFETKRFYIKLSIVNEIQCATEQAVIYDNYINCLYCNTISGFNLNKITIDS